MFISELKDGSLFFHGRVDIEAPPPAGQQTAFVFISLIVLSLLRDTTQLNSDGTFESVPRIFEQMFTIHLNYMGKVKRL